MRKTDFAYRINRLDQLVSGMKARAEEVALWGYPAEFTDDLSGHCAEIKRLQDVKNANKAEGKATMVRQSVRSRLPREDWNLFGFYHGESARPKNDDQAEPEQTEAEGWE